MLPKLQIRSQNLQKASNWAQKPWTNIKMEEPTPTKFNWLDAKPCARWKIETKPRQPAELVWNRSWPTWTTSDWSQTMWTESESQSSHQSRRVWSVSRFSSSCWPQADVIVMSAVLLLLSDAMRNFFFRIFVSVQLNLRPSSCPFWVNLELFFIKTHPNSNFGL